MRKCHWIFNLPAGFHAELNGCEAAAPPLFVFWDDHQRILGPIAFLACSNYPRIRHKKKSSSSGAWKMLSGWPRSVNEENCAHCFIILLVRQLQLAADHTVAAAAFNVNFLISSAKQTLTFLLHLLCNFWRQWWPRFKSDRNVWMEVVDRIMPIPGIPS